MLSNGPSALHGPLCLSLGRVSTRWLLLTKDGRTHALVVIVALLWHSVQPDSLWQFLSWILHEALIESSLDWVRPCPPLQSGSAPTVQSLLCMYDHCVQSSCPSRLKWTVFVSPYHRIRTNALGNVQPLLTELSRSNDRIYSRHYDSYYTNTHGPPCKLTVLFSTPIKIRRIAIAIKIQRILDCHLDLWTVIVIDDNKKEISAPLKPWDQMTRHRGASPASQCLSKR